MVYDYAELLGSYHEALHTNLRHFRPGPDFLDTWVPDEDPSRSIFGIFESAEMSGLASLSLSVSSKIAEELSLEELREQLATLGTLTSITDSKGLLLEFTPSRLKIHLCYLSRLTVVSTDIRCEGWVPMLKDNSIRLEVRARAAHLVCEIEADNGQILQCRHDGAHGAERVILDQLCQSMVGLPIQEASHHALLRVEEKLRDEKLPRPVPGVLTPLNADPAFALSNQLIHELYKKYLKLTHTSPTRNFWAPKPSAEWLSLSSERKSERIRTELNQATLDLKLPVTSFELVEIKNQTRVVLSLGVPPLDGTKPATQLIKVEKLLQRRVEPLIEIILESREDKNQRSRPRIISPSPTPIAEEKKA